MTSTLCPMAILCFVFSAASAAAEPPEVNKSEYSLLNPTPREQWRDLSADRPDFTESPYTVDAGAVQLEMSFFDYSKDGDDEAYAIVPFNLKLGLLNDVDVQLVFGSYVHEEMGDAGSSDGIGDTQVRVKINLWGNDGGNTAFAFMPVIKIPTASDEIGNDKVEGGLIFPFAVGLAQSVGLGLMFEVDFVFDDADDSYDTEFIMTGVLGIDVSDEVGVYIEGIGITSTDSEVDFRGVLGVGATYGVSENVLLDVGLNIGLTDDVDDVNVFSGITIRF